MSGTLMRGSMATNSARPTIPVVRMAIITGWGSKGNASMLNPSSSPASPMLKLIAPNQSIDCRSNGRTGSRSRQIPHNAPKMPMGTLNRKTQRQDISVSSPPTIGPIRKPAAPAIWFTPSPRPICPFLNASVTITVLFVTSSAAPTPCIIRPTIRSAA